MINKFMNDPAGNTLAVIVLAVLIISWVISLVLVLRNKPVPTNKSWFTLLLPLFALPAFPALLDLLRTNGIALVLAVFALAALTLATGMPLLVLISKSPPEITQNWQRWIIPILVAAGFAAAGYLTYVEVTGLIPQCGEMSGCGDVQSSQYATLFGVLPVGVLGLIGYFGILAAWLVWQYGPDNMNKMSALAIWGMCLFGVLFSAYLTFLEPFVIGATCMWCITSAVLMILLLWASTPAAHAAMEISDED